MLCVDAQKYIRKSYLTARLFLVAQGDRVKAVGFCQRRNRSSLIIQHAFWFMKCVKQKIKTGEINKKLFFYGIANRNTVSTLQTKRET